MSQSSSRRREGQELEIMGRTEKSHRGKKEGRVRVCPKRRAVGDGKSENFSCGESLVSMEGLFSTIPAMPMAGINCDACTAYTVICESI